MSTRRFYKQAVLSADGLGVMLDARTLRTPGGMIFRAPGAALARAVAAEWEAQGDLIAPSTMPLSQLAFAALDSGAEARLERAAYVTKFGETDLCCHRAERPAELAAYQAALWDPLAAWGAEALGAHLPVVVGVLPAEVPVAALEALKARAAALDDFALTGLAHAAGLTGSALIAFALQARRIGAEDAFKAAALDELWSLDRWGDDEEARARLDRLKRDLNAVSRFFEALSD